MKKEPLKLMPLDEMGKLLGKIATAPKPPSGKSKDAVGQPGESKDAEPNS